MQRIQRFVAAEVSIQSNQFRNCKQKLLIWVAKMYDTEFMDALYVNA